MHKNETGQSSLAKILPTKNLSTVFFASLHSLTTFFAQWLKLAYLTDDILEYERESDKDWQKRVRTSFEIGPQQLQKEHAIWSKVKMSTDILS